MQLPCNFDHNGECLVCDCWPDDCAYLRYQIGDYSYETREKLEEMFKDYKKDQINKIIMKDKISQEEIQEYIKERYPEILKGLELRKKEIMGTAVNQSFKDGYEIGMQHAGQIIFFFLLFEAGLNDTGIDLSKFLEL